MKTDIRKCDVTSINALYHDCCLSDYFQGSDADEVLAVPVWHNMTNREALESCKESFNSNIGYFDDVAGSGGMADSALNTLFDHVGIDEVADFVKYIEPDETEENESCYLYVGLYAESDIA